MTTTHAIFHHCRDRIPTHGGYVVRGVTVDADGAVIANDYRNYGGVDPVTRTYKRQTDAQRAADKLNSGAA